MRIAKKQVLSFLTALVMVIGLAPVSAFSDGEDGNGLTILSDPQTVTLGPAAGHLEADAGSVHIVVEYGADAGIPAGAELRATAIAEGSAAYAKYEQQLTNKYGSNDTSVEISGLFELSIVQGDETIYQSADVNVAATLPDDTILAKNNLHVIRFDGQDAELNEINGTTLSETTVSFDTSKLSVFAIASTRDGYYDIYLKNGQSEFSLRPYFNEKGSLGEELFNKIYNSSSMVLYFIDSTGNYTSDYSYSKSSNNIILRYLDNIASGDYIYVAVYDWDNGEWLKNLDENYLIIYLNAPDKQVTSFSDDTFTYEIDLNSGTASVTGLTEAAANKKEFTIPSSITYTGGNASESVSFSVTSIAPEAFRGKSGLNVTIPGDIIVEGKFVNDSNGSTGAFAYCTDTTVTFSGKNVTLKGSAFQGCRNLTVKDACPEAGATFVLGQKAFAFTENLNLETNENVRISGSEQNVFQRTSGKLTFLGGVQSIGGYSFIDSGFSAITTTTKDTYTWNDYGFGNLENGVSVTIKAASSDTSIRWSQWSGVSGLTIDFEQAITSLPNFERLGNGIIPVNININGGINEISGNSFDGITFGEESLIVVKAIDESVTVEENAIPDTENLSVYFDLDKEDVIGSELLDGYTLTDITYKSDNAGEEIADDQGIFTIEIDSQTKNATITGLSSTYEGDGNIAIPAKISYKSRQYKVAAIAEEAFREEDRIKTISFNNGSNSITVHPFAFSQMPNLTEVSGNGQILASNNEDSSAALFEECPELTSLSIRISNVRQIARSNAKLSDVTLELTDNYTIDSNAFIDQANLENLTIRSATSKKVTLSVESNAFGANANLKSFACETPATQISANAFKGCNKLETVIFTGKESQNILKGAFAGVTGIKTLRIDNPYNVASGAFAVSKGTYFVQNNDAPVNGNLTEKIGKFENYIFMNNPWWMSSDGFKGSKAPKQIYISRKTLTKDFVGAVRNAGSALTDVYIDCEREDLSFADELDMANGNVTIHYNTNVVETGIYLDGKKGNDETGTGTEDQPFRTFAALKKALENPEEIGNRSNGSGTKSGSETTMTDIATAACEATGIQATIGTFVNQYEYIHAGFILNTVSITEDETWENDGDPLTIYRAPGFKDEMVKVSGSLTLKNIILDGNKTKVTASGSIIKVQPGATLNIGEGAVLQNNSYPQSGWDGYNWTNGGAVYAKKATVNVLSGSLITGNLAMYGGGIQVDGGTLNMSGGTISNNVAKATTYSSGVAVNGSGGGVSLVYGSVMNLSGGEIINNISDGCTSYGIGLSGSTGGGIQVGAPYANEVTFVSNVLNMTGGSVSNNSAYAEGGGIEIQANCVANISGGNILGNSSGGGEFGGGGIYVNASRGYGTANGLLKLNNVLITNNDATYGGGIACCETVNLSIYMGRGAAIYGNYDSWRGYDNDIFFFMRQTGVGTKAKVASTMMNGADYNWTYYTFNDYTPSDDSIVSGEPVPESMLAYINAGRTGSFAIKSNPSDKKVNASVVIAGNYAETKGGGIGSNGNIIIGDVPPTSDVTITPVVNKTVIGRDMKKGEVYTFSVYLEESSSNGQRYEGEFRQVYTYTDTLIGTGTVTGGKDGIPKSVDMPSYTVKNVGNDNLGDTYTLLVLEDTRSSNALTADDGTYYAFRYVISQGINGYQASLEKIEKGTYVRDEDGNPVFAYDRQERKGYVPFQWRIRGAVNEAEFINYPLDRDAEAVKIWMDDNKQIDAPEGARITMTLLADGEPAKDLNGNPVRDIILDGTADETGEIEPWKAHWGNLPMFSDDQHETRIVYTVVESDIQPLYFIPDNGTPVAEMNEPAVLINKLDRSAITERTVRKEWNDDGNREGIRPTSIVTTLTADGAFVQQVTLSDANGWTATVKDLPVNRDGKAITYAWTEQEVTGYTQESAETTGTVTVFTNRVIRVVVEVPPEEPQPDVPQQPKKGGWNGGMIIEDYLTALGGEWLINHVGDCFD